jgi:hypothetical protein
MMMCRSLLPGGAGYRELPPVGHADAEEQEPDVSLITGRLRNAGIAADSAGELAVYNDKAVAVLHQGGGGQFLANRYEINYSSEVSITADITSYWYR